MQVLQGSLVALVTPMLPNGDVDYSCLENLIDWHIGQGTDGIVSVGTTGESATLNVKEHLDVIAFTVKHTNKRIPVIAGSGANSTSEAIDLTKESKRLGADFALIVTPYYNKPNQNGLIAHFSAIADAVDIDQILYNVPSRTACDLLPSSVSVLSKHENIIGIKEASGDMDQAQQILKDCASHIQVISGDDALTLPMLLAGAVGTISVLGNALPIPLKEMFHYVEIGNLKKAYALHYQLLDVINLIFEEGNPVGIKALMESMDYCEGTVRLPLIKATPSLKERLQRALETSIFTL